MEYEEACYDLRFPCDLHMHSSRYDNFLPAVLFHGDAQQRRHEWWLLD